ncbi:synaptotagmin-9-like [Clytia hemisphaerica]|uniref:C2 domain-containing protein n=1 Tax=Clytia hemisphaerica TaxID=252671 RepID=A0A7M5V4B9_9CNID
MVSFGVSLALLVSGVVFFIVDIFLMVLAYCWWRRKKKEKELEAKAPERVPLFHQPGPLTIPPTSPVTAQTDIQEFAIPKLIERRKNKLAALVKPANILESGLDPVQYGGTLKITMKNKPKLGFEFIYDFRSTQLKVALAGLKNIKKFINEQILVTISMSHSTILYHSSKVEGSDPVMSEEYPFPLDSMEISSDPPIICKFNVWHVDKNSGKRPYGFVEVKIEDVLTKMNNIQTQGNVIWRNIILTDHLVDEGRKGELLITLSYLSAAQRISCTIVKAKGLILTANDKDLYAKMTLFCRGEEQQTVSTNYIELTQNPEFHQEFIFRFSNIRNASIDGISLRVDIIARQNGLLSDPRFIGRCDIGNSNSVDRVGKEHWVSALTSPKSVTQWHHLKDPSNPDLY